MEKSIVAVEEALHCSSSGSRSFASFVRINSISIDITCPMEEIEPPHDHFSIRGFVAGMRKKNLKMCSPFSSEDDNNGLIDSLPLLSVPKYRWWQCSHCVADTTAERGSLEMASVNPSNDIAAPSSHQNTDAASDGSLGSSGVPFPYKRKPKLRSLADIMEEQNNNSAPPSSSNGTTTESDFELHPSSPQKKKKKIVLAERKTTHSETGFRATRSNLVHVSDSEETLRLNSEIALRKKKVKPPHQKEKVSRKQRQVDDENITDLTEKTVAGSTFMGETETVPFINGNCEVSNSQDKDGLDLCLNSYSDHPKTQLSQEQSLMKVTVIPDLNETIGGNLEMSEGNGEGFKRDDGNNNADDIPMEIVELLAKNQQERATEKSSSQQQEIASCSSAVDVSGPLPDMINFPFSSRSSNGFLNFPHEKNYQFGRCNQGLSQFKLFSPLLQGKEQKTPYIGSNSVRGEREDLPWSFNVCHTQGNGFTFSDQNHKGKSICDFNSIGKDLRIPAMQLLSLTNQRSAIESPFQVGYRSVVDRNHHDLNKNQLLLGSSLFSLNTHLRNSLPLHNAASFPAQMAPPQRAFTSIPSVSNLQICVMNRNPADFSIPEAGNVFTTSAKDLRFRKRNNGLLMSNAAPENVPKRKWVRRNSPKDNQIKNVRKAIPKKGIV